MKKTNCAACPNISGNTSNPAVCVDCSGHVVRAVICVTGNGGGLLRVSAVNIPLQIWDDGEAREYIEENQLLPVTLDGSEGYEVMSAKAARTMAGELLKAAGRQPRQPRRPSPCAICSGTGALNGRPCPNCSGHGTEAK